MSLSIGIVGLPNVGKSTLFAALTKKQVLIANYPFATIDPSVGVVAVPDPRVQRLSELLHSKKTVPAIVEFVDIAGLVKGASGGEGLGNQFLANIRETDAIAQVVRLFDDDDITHVHGEIDPLRDIEVINMELILADLESAQKRLDRVERDSKSGDKDAIAERDLLQRIVPVLESGKLARTLTMTEKEQEIVKSFHLLTMKPILYVLNRKNGAINVDAEGGERWRVLKTFFEETNAPYVFVDAQTERELTDVDEVDKMDFRRELGVAEDGLDALIKKGYETLNLISFFTTGETETRAWTIHRGDTAPVAGAAIHSDFRDKFIRAEVISAQKLVEAGGYGPARQKGWVRTEGKEYVVEDGDVMVFLHS